LIADEASDEVSDKGPGIRVLGPDPGVDVSLRCSEDEDEKEDEEDVRLEDEEEVMLEDEENMLLIWPPSAPAVPVIRSELHRDLDPPVPAPIGRSANHI
jgi:hypothetical protein